MLTEAQNALLTQTSRGTPCGELMRRYWQPVALSAELEADVPLPVHIMGESLVLFRDDAGRPALIERRCAHRGVDLSYGRCEDGGLRCLFHGWLFDPSGKCLEQPGEPPESTYHERIRLTAYPCHEAGEMIFAYLGPGDPPHFPRFDWFKVEPTHRFVGKMYQECNFQQANEGNLDQIHLSFLHRIPPVDGNLGRTMPGTGKRHRELLAIDARPRIEAERTAFGMRELVTRNVPDGDYFKVEAFVLPNLAIFPGGGGGRDGYQGHWHVPIDDVSHWKYVIRFSEREPVDQEQARKVYFGDELGAEFRFKRNAANRYGQDRDEMRKYPFVGGFGPSFPVHDSFASEAMGAIADRTTEHLTQGDKSVALMRRVMFDAIAAVQRGEDAPKITDDAGEFDGMLALGHIVPRGTDVSAYLGEVLEQRRCHS